MGAEDSVCSSSAAPPLAGTRPTPLREQQPPPALPTVEGGWKTILADPPWRFTNRTGKVAPEHRRLDRYSTIDMGTLCSLAVADVAARDAHLYLWVPNALVPEGLRVMEAWGFRYVSNLIWAKRRKDGGPMAAALGFYFRNVTEPVLFGVRGSLRTLPPGRSQVNMIESRKREHSRKPDEQYDLIERCSPGPYLEMFARHRRPGWSVWGDEAAPHVTPRTCPPRLRGWPDRTCPSPRPPSRRHPARPWPDPAQTLRGGRVDPRHRGLRGMQHHEGSRPPGDGRHHAPRSRAVTPASSDDDGDVEPGGQLVGGGDARPVDHPRAGPRSRRRAPLIGCLRPAWSTGARAG